MMGYFSNATEAEAYEAAFCSRCVHYAADGRRCPVWMAHFLYSYKLANEGEDNPGKAMLDAFIPVQGARNGRCTMFVQGEAEEDDMRAKRLLTPSEIVTSNPAGSPTIRKVSGRGCSGAGSGRSGRNTKEGRT